MRMRVKILLKQTGRICYCCQLPWKAEVMLSRVISETSDNKLLTEKAITLYLSDYPQLVDIDR